jgi:hypothetical protein
VRNELGTVILGLSLVVAVSACKESTRDEAREEAQQQAADAAEAATGVPEVVSLTEGDVTGFISAATELRRLGVETEMGESDVRNLAVGLRKNREAMAILERNGFDSDRFVQVTYSIGLALGALEMKAKEGEITKSREEQERMLESMKAQMPAEQYEMMRKQMEVGAAMYEQFQDQPEQNLQLVEKYRAQIEATSKS